MNQPQMQSSLENPAPVETLSQSKKDLTFTLSFLENLNTEMEKRVDRGTQEGTSGDEGDVLGNCTSAIITALDAAIRNDLGELGDAKLYFNKWGYDLQQMIKKIKTMEAGVEKDTQRKGIDDLILKIKTKIEEVLAK